MLPVNGTCLVYPFADPANGRAWLVRLVPMGGRYGRHNCLINGDNPNPVFASKEPLVEFYDFTNPHFEYDFEGSPEEARSAGALPLGQFVSRYNLSTLLERHPAGLCLQGDVPVWSISMGGMGMVIDWLERNTTNCRD